MTFNSIFDVLGGVVLIGLTTAVVTSPNTAKQITAAGGAFSNVLASALGKGSVA